MVHIGFRDKEMLFFIVVARMLSLSPSLLRLSAVFRVNAMKIYRYDFFMTNNFKIDLKFIVFDIRASLYTFDQ